MNGETSCTRSPKRIEKNEVNEIRARGFCLDDGVRQLLKAGLNCCSALIVTNYFGPQKKELCHRSQICYDSVNNLNFINSTEASCSYQLVNLHERECRAQITNSFNKQDKMRRHIHTSDAHTHTNGYMRNTLAECQNRINTLPLLVADYK